MRTRTSTPDAGFRLDHSLGFLAAQLSKKLTARFNERLAVHALTTTQWAVLACLWAEDGLSQSELSRRSGIDPATLAEMLKRMEARGFVRRGRDEDNGRIQRVHLAVRDPGLRDEIVTSAAEVNALATTELTKAEAAQLLELLRRAIQSLDSIPPSS